MPSCVFGGKKNKSPSFYLKVRRVKGDDEMKCRKVSTAQLGAGRHTFNMHKHNRNCVRIAAPDVVCNRPPMPRNGLYVAASHPRQRRLTGAFALGAAVVVCMILQPAYVYADYESDSTQQVLFACCVLYLSCSAFPALMPSAVLLRDSSTSLCLKGFTS
jgi:hypothetical protein